MKHTSHRSFKTKCFLRGSPALCLLRFCLDSLDASNHSRFGRRYTSNFMRTSAKGSPIQIGAQKHEEGHPYDLRVLSTNSSPNRVALGYRRSSHQAGPHWYRSWRSSGIIQCVCYDDLRMHCIEVLEGLPEEYNPFVRPPTQYQSSANLVMQ